MSARDVCGFPLSMLMFLLVAIQAPLAALDTRIVLRGELRQCFAVRILDRDAAIDSLYTDSCFALGDTTSAELIGMQTTVSVASSNGDVTTIDDVVAKTYPLKISHCMDSILVLREPLILALRPGDLYQVIVPITADTVIVDSVVFPMPWNGRCGGIVDIRARNLLIVNDTITATAYGYRGGRRSGNGGSCNIVQPCDVRGSTVTGEKGEGCKTPDSTCISGHLPWANGGGGGDAHNAGGGGGGNGGSGGRGGDQWRCGGTPGMWGLPGMRITGDVAPILTMGGGGGGGHQNNNVATDGASGGGLIRLTAPLLRSDSLDTIVVATRGGSVSAVARNDGGGAGGAGGTVEVMVCETESPIHLDVAGGRGGNCDGGHGPGGGGGGGRIIIHPVLLASSGDRVSWDTSGGASGVTSAGDTFAAQQGQPGVVDVPCTELTVPTVTDSMSNNVGDTMMIRVEPQEFTSCATLFTHTVTIAGTAVTPIASDPPGYIVSTLATQDSTRIVAQGVSTQGWTVYLLGVLAEDTTATITVSTSSGVCIWQRDPIIVHVQACALPERRVRVTSPTRLDVRAIERRLYGTVQVANGVAYSLQLMQMDGRIVWSMHDVGAEIPVSISERSVEVPSGIYALVLSTPWQVLTQLIPIW